MTDETKTILGRPINGDVDKRYFKPVEQWGAERLIADLDAIFAADPNISAINWRQYTPYFNDGDPCEFSAYLNEDGLVAYDRVPTHWSWDEAYDDEGEIRVETDSYFRHGEYDRERGYVFTLKDIPAAAEVIQLLSNFQHYEAVCREHFGEHSQVIATRDGFNVEYYEHD